MSKTTTTKPEANTAEKAPKAKLPKTVLESGLTYSLCSRLFNALPLAKKNELMSKTKSLVSMVDGRGAEKQVPEIIITLAESLGAKFLASTRTSFLRPRIDINWSKATIELKELEKPVAKEETKEVKKAS